MIVEVCANSWQSALNAEIAGADRIELCSELGVGGITPSLGLLRKVLDTVAIPVHVLIRPRSGDFTYSDLEFEIMKEDILQCLEMGVAGVVTGILHADFTLDIMRTKELVELSDKMTFTFHRAFDWVADPYSTLQQLEEIGVDNLLSSGQEKSAIEGISLLGELQKSAVNCKIMPGSGIDEINVLKFKENGFEVVHLSGTQFHKSLAMAPKISMNSTSFLQEDQIAITSINRIKKIVKRVK